MKTLKIPLLTLVLILGLLIYIFITTQNQVTDDFSLNLITEIIGILLTVLLIDFAIKRREKKEKHDILKNTYAQYKRPARRLLQYFASIYKASTIETPVEWNTDFKTLLSAKQFYESVRYLDFLKPAPVTPKTDWINHSHIEINRIKADLEKILDKYAFVLDSKTIADLEWVINHWLLETLLVGPSIKVTNESSDSRYTSICLLAIDGDIGQNGIKGLIDKVLQISEDFKSVTDDTSDISYSSQMWQDNMAPKLSQSRVSE